MSETLKQFGIDRLDIPERLKLIGVIWDSIVDTKAAQPIPEWHQREIERRLAAADADPGAGIPWEEIKARLIEDQ